MTNENNFISTEESRYQRLLQRLEDVSAIVQKEYGRVEGAASIASESRYIILKLETELKELKEFREKAFKAHPNLDLDIEHFD